MSPMKKLRRLFFRLFPRYRRLELRCETWQTAASLMRGNARKPEREQWGIAREEDTNRVIGVVYIERRERITE